MRPTSIFTAAALAACAMMAGPAGIASTQPSSPYETIRQLETEGYTVNIDRVGTAPLNECVVTSVRNPQTVTQWIRVRDGRDKNGDIDWDLVPVVVSRSISVSLNCTRT
jgi:hypothetical protein